MIIIFDWRKGRRAENHAVVERPIVRWIRSQDTVTWFHVKQDFLQCTGLSADALLVIVILFVTDLRFDVVQIGA